MIYFMLAPDRSGDMQDPDMDQRSSRKSSRRRGKSHARKSSRSRSKRK